MSIRIETRDKVFTVLIDRQKVKNAVDVPTASALADAFRAFDENVVIWQSCLFNTMAGADVRSPCGEFAKCQGIIHFAFAESRKLSSKL